MYDLLSDLTVVEGASFIAAPSCALHLQQFGAKVIRFDNIGGGPDYRRWPLNDAGDSLYWEGLNKGKLSVALDLSRPEGRELAAAIITAPGPGRGLFVTNYPRDGFLAHAKLRERRSDLVTLRVQGWPDGRNGVDYTINAAVGVPMMTGDDSQNGAQPVNAVLPAWDLLTGAYAAFSLMAAERQRRVYGRDIEINLALSDVAIGALGHLGQISETLMAGDRPRIGNALFGAFGRDFATRDGRRVMIVAITARQWKSLVQAFDIAKEIGDLEAVLGVSFTRDEGQRYRYREALFALLEKATAKLDFVDLTARLEASGVCWEPYQSLAEAIANDPRLVRDNEIFSTVAQLAAGSVPVPGAFARISERERGQVQPARRLGQDSEAVLADHLGLPSGEISKLVDQGVIGV